MIRRSFFPRLRLRLAGLAFLFTALAGGVLADDAGLAQPTPGVKKLLTGSLLRRAAGQAAATAASEGQFATDFTFSGSTPGFVSLVNGLTTDETQRRDLLAMLAAGREAFEKDAAAAGLPNDVAAAMATFITTHWGYAHGATVEDAATVTFARQLQAVLQTNGLGQAGNAEKQALYEWFLGTTIFTTAGWEQAKKENDTATLAALRTASGEALHTLLGLDPDSLSFGAAGLSLAPEPAASAATLSAASPSSGDSLTPGSLAGGRPSGLFWRLKVGGSSLGVSTLVFLPDGRLASALKTTADGRLDWAAVTASGDNGQWELRDGQLTIVRWAQGRPETAPFVVEQTGAGEPRLRFQDEQWTPAAAPPARMDGRYKTSSSGSLTTSGYSMAGGGATSITTHASFFGTYVFSGDGRYTTNAATLASSSSNHTSDGSTDWAGTGGQSSAHDGTYQISGYSLVLKTSQGVTVHPFLWLTGKSVLISGEIYARQE